MPYIKGERRPPIKKAIDTLFPAGEFPKIDHPGDLNYAITYLVKKYIDQQPGGINYKNVNEVIGVLECAKLEFYRKDIAPYEDEKEKENGSV